MKSMLSVILAVSLVSLTCFAQEAAPDVTIQGPRIACDEPLFDFGTADSEATIEHTFVIKNIGDTSLEISNVRPACGCTLANISDKIVPPGGESRITANLSLKGRTGPQNKPITIQSNDPQNPDFRVTLVGNVATAIQTTPDRLMFGNIGQGQVLEQVIEVSSVSDQPFSITGLQPTMPEMETEQEVVEAGQHYRVKVTYTGPQQTGPINGELRIMTDHPARPVINVPVIANIVGELIYAPSVIELPSTAINQAMTRYVVVRPGNLETFELKNVITPDPSIRATIYPFGNQGYRIQLENMVPSAEINGKVIRIETTAERMAAIEIPIVLK